MDNDTTTLLNQLYRLEWLLRRKEFERYREGGPWGSPHRGQGRVLALLKLHPEISQKDLGAILDIRSQSLGELLAKLEKQGLIERESSEEDKRVMMVRLTEAGKAGGEEQEASSDADSFASCLSEEERTNFAGYLRRIIESLEEELGVEGAGPVSPEDFFRDPRHAALGALRGGDPRGRGPFDPRRRGMEAFLRGGFPPRGSD